MSRAGFSHWWPTPVRPGDHFDAEDLARSAAVHAPLRRLRVALTLVQVGLLAISAWALGRPGLLGDPEWSASPEGLGLGDPARWARAAIGAGAVVLSWRLVGAVAAAALARQPRVDAIDGPGSSWPAPVRAVVTTAGPAAMLTVAGALLLGPLTDPSSGWAVVGGAVVGVMVASALSTAARVQRAVPGRVGFEIPSSWTALVDRVGLGDQVHFGRLLDPADGATGPHPVGPPPGPPAPAPWVGANACATGLGRQRRILVDADLTAAPLADFVVAHELTHLRRRHPELQLVLNGLVVAVALGAVPVLAATGWPWSAVGRDPADPLALPLMVLIVGVAGRLGRIPVSWVLRALERQADAGAVALVGVPDRHELRALHLGAGGELAPPRLANLLAVHPAPAERLEYLERCRVGGPIGTW